MDKADDKLSFDNNGRISVDVDKLVQSPKFKQAVKDCVTLREIPPDEGDQHVGFCNAPDCDTLHPVCPGASTWPAAPKDGADELLREALPYLNSKSMMAHEFNLCQRIDAYLVRASTEGWQPIETAPKGLPGFLATDEEFDSIEWLIDHGGDQFCNQNSGNMTRRDHWKFWMPLPASPKGEEG